MNRSRTCDIFYVDSQPFRLGYDWRYPTEVVSDPTQYLTPMSILDDLLSQSENLDGDPRFSFGLFRPWSYSFHDALTISHAAFSVLENDWKLAFDQQASLIPDRFSRVRF
ncbi:MAG: hypothetical protein Aurels2KO_32540 [Aureliella sp.]